MVRHSYHPSAARKFLSSSVVERSAVNRLVVGSNPTSGARRMSLPPNRWKRSPDEPPVALCVQNYANA